MLMIPAVFGSAVYQLNQFIGTLLASFLPEGSISWLYYADRLVQFPLGVFAIAISTAALPSLSTHVARNDLRSFGSTLEHALRMVFFLTLPSMAGLIALGEPIIMLFFERGAFGSNSTAMTCQALIFYSVGLWAFSGIRVLVAAFYSVQDTRTPVKVASVSLVFNVAMSLLLMGPLRHGGLALALALSSSLQFCLLAWLLAKRIKVGFIRPSIITLVRGGLSSIVMVCIVLFLESRWLAITQGMGTLDVLLRLSGLIFVGASAYFAVSRLMGCREANEILDIFRRGKAHGN
jgi:putative peptidoglycan lipid II flippase